MNSRYLLLIIISLILCHWSIAQNKNYNPYERFGVKADVLTLSNGKYNEFFDTDTIEIIGSAILNTKTMRVIGFVELDTLYSEATLEPEVVSRFLSRDPLAREFSQETPYSYAQNSPIAYIDVIGLQKFLAITFGSDVRYRGANLVLKVPEADNININANSSAKEGLINALKEATAADPKGIGFLAIFSHGVPDMLFGSGGYSNGITTENLDDLEAAVMTGDVTFAEGAIVYLGGCNSGTCGSFFDENGNLTSLAQRFANISGATVVGAENDQVGPLDESNGNLVFTTAFPQENQFAEFTPDAASSAIGSTVDVVQLAVRARSRTKEVIQRIEPRRVTSIPVSIPERQIALPNNGGN